MSDLQPANQAPRNKGDKGYLHEVNDLIAVLKAVTAEVDDIAKNLKTRYPKEGLLALSLQFEEISKNFTTFSTQRSQPLFGIITSSKDRLAFAGSVANEAKKLAQFFERYSKNPNSYSPTTSRIAINKLQVMLTNLKDACPADSNHI